MTKYTWAGVHKFLRPRFIIQLHKKKMDFLRQVLRMFNGLCGNLIVSAILAMYRLFIRRVVRRGQCKLIVCASQSCKRTKCGCKVAASNCFSAFFAAACNSIVFVIIVNRQLIQTERSSLSSAATTAPATHPAPFSRIALPVTTGSSMFRFHI